VVRTRMHKHVANPRSMSFDVNLALS
jgi:hypothetical protein